MNNFSAVGPSSGSSGYVQPQQHESHSMSPGDSQPHGDGAGQRSNNNRHPPPDSALTDQDLQTLLVVFGGSGGKETGTCSHTSGTTCAPSSSQISTAAYMYACKDPPGACGVPFTACTNNGNANEIANATDAPMPVVDDITPSSLLSQSLAANITTASAGAGWSTNFDQQQAQQTDQSFFQWNPSATNMAKASPQGNGVMHVGPSVPHQSAVAVTATVCKAPSSSAPTIDQSIPPFTLEDERRELATMSIDEIISVEKDLRGVQANLGGMSLSSDPTQREGKVSPPTAKKKKRCREATPPSKKKECLPPPPDDAVKATDADILRLDAELNTIEPSYKDAYLHACLHCPSEVNSRDRKAAFLEREGLNASRAALRLVAYWELRLSTFGADRAFLPMTIDGAIQDDVADMIQHCVVHVMPLTDTSGRAVVFYQPSRRNLAAFPIKQEGRALFYLFDSLTLDPTIRRAGFVGIADYRNVSRSQISTKQQRHMKALFEVMPIRIRSCHICHPSPVMSYAYPILKYILGRSVRLRTRLHSGSEQYVLHELASCSLPRKCLPQELGGEVVLDLAQWVANRSIVETSMALDEQSMQHSVEQQSNPGAKNFSQTASDRNDGDDVLLTGDEARRAVIGRFTDELMAIGEAVGLKRPLAEARCDDSPGHTSSSFSEATQF